MIREIKKYLISQTDKHKRRSHMLTLLNAYKKNQDQEGFTLVELMIVVAIIGILAAIAIPQFAAYRIRGYNSSSQSDVRNLNTTQAAFFSDWQTYGVTEQRVAASPDAAVAACAGGNGGLGAVVQVASATNGYPMITSDDNSANARAMVIPVGNGVWLVASTDAATAPALATSMVAMTKHLQGDTFYAVDGDSTAVYMDSAAGTTSGVGYTLASGDEPTSVSGADDFAGVTGPSGNIWVAK
ncbi:MAG: prepilin-type N-terminal cleavage/methylation domain-containing protein [Thermodesulfobacteriota bacterium]